MQADFHHGLLSRVRNREATASANSGSLMWHACVVTGIPGRSDARNSLQEARVGIGIPESAARHGRNRQPLGRHHDGDWAHRLVQPLGEHTAELDHFLGKRADERELWIVRVDRPPSQFRRNRLGPAMHGEINTARHDDLRQAEFPNRPKPIRSGGMESTHQFIGQFVGREVDDAGEQPVGSQFLHRRARRRRWSGR